MKKLLLLAFVIAGFAGKAQTLFANAFGDTTRPALVFLHDGPGDNPVSFELGCANTLADAGYRVITFDQRGCGRSKKDAAADHYKFNKANEDINIILKRYHVTEAVFIGSGWGGTSAIKFAEVYPEKVKGIILVGSALNYQLVFKSILQKCEEKFKEKKDTAALRKVKDIKKLDTAKLDYSSKCYELAEANGLYNPRQPSAEREAIYDEMKKNKKFEYVGKMSGDPVYGFFMNERYTTLDMNYYVKKLIDKKIPVYGLYGKEDGLFNDTHIAMIKKTLGDANVVLVDEASHNIFLDQRTAFVAQVKKWLAPPPPTDTGKKKK
jgi:proline iminopeptidase